MKLILNLLILIFLNTFVFASDNISDNLTIPHTFNSGETISSSKMNENFKDISSFINSNLLKIKYDDFFPEGIGEITEKSFSFYNIVEGYQKIYDVPEGKHAYFIS